MPGTRRNPWLRLLHLAVITSMLLAVVGPAVQPPPSRAQALAETPTPSATEEAMPTAEASPTSEASATTEPSPTLEASATAEPSPSLEASPTTELSPTPEATMAPPAAQSARRSTSARPDSAQPGGLDVGVEPPEALPGETVTITVRYVARSALKDAVLELVLAPGLSFEAAASQDAVYDGEQRRLHWPLAQIERGATVERSFQARIGENAPDLTVQRIELRTAGASQASGEGIVKRPFPGTEVRIAPGEGGELRSPDGRVRVVFPKGAAQQKLRVVHRPLRVDRLRPPGVGIALEFELIAETDDAAASPVRKFDKPLELRVDLTGLVNWDPLPDYQYPFLGYLDDEGHWIEIPARRDGCVLIASLDHFSFIGSGTNEQMGIGWVLAYNDANVSAFSGGLDYTYPIQLPAGRGGLTPNLDLTYNSRRVDGIVNWTQADWAGLGWQVNTVEIVRHMHPDLGKDWQGVPYWCSGVTHYWDHEGNNTFTLIVNGAGYTLLPQANNRYGRYYTEDEQFLYVERRNDVGGNGSPYNQTGEYWIVRLRDGAEYRLGYNEDSEQTVCNAWYSGGSNWYDYAGRVNGLVAYRWRVDRIQDTRGNRIEFSYYDDEQPRCACGVREKASYLTEVRYNFQGGVAGTRVIFGLAMRPGNDGVFLDWSQCDCCPMLYQDRYLDNITIQNLDGTQYRTVRQYVLGYAAPRLRADNCFSRILSSITEKGTDLSALPATTFGYTVFANKDTWPGCSTEWEREAFGYERLTSISNGYGGTTTITYGTPDYCHQFCCSWAWNYRVQEKLVSDGRGGGHKLSYSYAPGNGDRMYENSSWPDYAYYYPVGSGTGGSLVGYRYVTETLKTVGGAALSSTGYVFRLNNGGELIRAAGRELLSTRRDAAGADLQKTATTWTIASTPSGGFFAYPSVVEEYWRQGIGLPTTAQKKTDYVYDTQYGNLTLTKEYLDGSVYRQTERVYYPNATLWIVDKPALETVMDGLSTALTRTRFCYDGAAYNVPPVRGNLTRLRQTTDAAASVFLTTQTITYTASFSMPIATSDALGHTTRTGYDANWRYPVVITGATGLTTTYEYDWAGRVTRVTGPNGPSTAVQYAYDTFSRLTGIVRPGDSLGFPTVAYSYADVSPLRIVTYQRAVAGNAAAVPTVRFYNGLGQLIQENQGTVDCSEMRVTNITYNAQGQQECVYVPYTTTFSWNYVMPMRQPKTAYTYDALGRLSTVTNPDGTLVRHFYDANATRLGHGVADESNHWKVSLSDVLGRLREVQEYTGSYPSATLYATTSYQYNTLDLLTGVTDAAGNPTSISYDPLGRKTAMTDPDMGSWSYGYDNAGNLLEQVDAKGQHTFFRYDPLNRLTGKAYRNDGTRPPDEDPQWVVAYQYDQGNLGKGQRTAMSDPSGSAAWTYDERGRVRSETKTIGGPGGGTFATAWTYGPRDEVASQTYPGGNAGQAGETVGFGYSVWGALHAVIGASSYVVEATLTADRRTDAVMLGGSAVSPVLVLDYVYYPWATANGRGRLQQIKAGTTGGPTSLQDLRYTYDAVGNVGRLEDWKAGSPEALNYSYDELDRLTAATGAYAEGYTYQAIGNLATKGGTGNPAYTYDATKKHAVTSVKGTSGTAGTVTVRAMGVNGDHGWPTLRLQVTGVDYGTQEIGSKKYTDYTWTNVTLTGNDVINVIYENDAGDREVWVESVTVSGRTIPSDGGAMIYDRSTASTIYDWIEASPGQRRMDVNGNLRTVVGEAAFVGVYDANGNLHGRLVDGKAETLDWDAENRLITATQGSNVVTFVYDGDGNRVKSATNGVTTAYVGSYYEMTGGVARTYYYFQGKRVAMRESGATYWLLGDHLGSTAIRADGSAARLGELRYSAWGLTRYTYGTILTDYRFTGQRYQDIIGLYDFGARWYDPVIGRFIQPDSIVPEPGNPQSLNRYTYCGNNSLRYIDPTGHLTEDEIMYYLDKDSWKEVVEYVNAQGRPGWLELLRRASLGDLVGVMNKSSEVLRGTLVDVKGKLYLQSSADQMLGAEEAAKMGDVYLDLKPYITPSGTQGYALEQPIYAGVKYVGPRLDPDRVDWVGVGTDVGGIVGDVVKGAGPVGFGIWLASEGAEMWKFSYDYTHGDFSGEAINQVAGVADFYRMSPGKGGITANLVSLAVNFGKATDWKQ